jgi:GntR family transcriptional regulator / MocR family aminotransferase
MTKRVHAALFPPVVLIRPSAVPLYRQLYNWFRRAIIEGQLRPGQRVPSTRSLCAELGISRIPALNAFEQLHAEGYLETFVGAGTCVARSIPALNFSTGSGRIDKTTARQSLRRISSIGKAFLSRPPQPWLENFGAFRVSLAALDHFPVGIWSRIVARHSRKPSIDSMAYGDPMGYMPLREAIAEYLRVVRAVRCDASQIMVVAGSQQGLQITARILSGPGDKVWLEEPGYPGARQAFLAAGARLCAVPVDREGLHVEQGFRLCPKARAAYLTPSHQYPLGMTLSAARRMQLLNWSARNGSWIIEDDYDSEYRFDSRPIASLQGMDSNARVLYIGTFSKILFPALRLGYVVLPEDLVSAFSAARESLDIFSPILYQAVLADFISEGHLARHIRRMRTLYRERRDALLAAIRETLGDRLEVVNAEAGMHLVGLLRHGIDDTTVVRRLAANGVSALPLSMCYRKKPPRGGLILGYGGTDAGQLRVGMRGLESSIPE